jgi:predicted permease
VALRKDLRHAVRIFASKPGFAIVVVLTLTLGIGANTAIFSLIYALLLRPFPYKDPSRLVRLQSASTRAGQAGVDVSIPDLEDYRRANRAFDDIGIFAPRILDVVDGRVAEAVNVALTTPGAFNALGVSAQLGRTFEEQEDRPGGDVYKAVLSYDLWQSRYGCSPDILGRQIRTPMATYTIVGVMPQGFGYPGRTQLWIPLQSYLKNSNKDWIKLRGSRMYPAIGRLRAGVSMAQGQADVDSISKRLANEYPNTNREFRLELQTLREAEVGAIRPYLMLLLAATTLVLVICTANIANLMLAVAADRARESTIRTALGASPMRLVRMFLTESCLLGICGGSIGLLLAVWGVHVLPHTIPTQLPSWVHIEVSWPVLAFNLFVSLSIGVAFGLAPALYTLRSNLSDLLRQGTRGSSQHGWLRKSLIVSEVAVCFTLLIGAGLLVKNFERLRRVAPGFASQHLLTFKMAPYHPGKGDEAVRRYVNFYDRVLRRLATVPGVLAAGAANSFPFENASLQRDQATIGVRGDNEQERMGRGAAVYADVTPGYFEAMGIPLLEGRYFNEADTHDKQMVVIISQRTARLLFPNRAAVGQAIRLVYLDSADPWGMVIGVVGDVKYTATETKQGLELYYPYTQYPMSTTRLAVRFQGGSPAVTQAIREAMAETAPETAVSDMRLMDQLILDTLWQQRLWGFLLGAFSCLALVLASLGLYGVLSHIVKQRTVEIGIRMALGAEPLSVLKLVTADGMRIVGVGLLLGLLSAAALTRFVRSLVSEISVSDPETYMSVGLLLLFISLLACWIPARRAARVDPLVTLRED